jgi:hypothetical protein
MATEVHVSVSEKRPREEEEEKREEEERPSKRARSVSPLPDPVAPVLKRIVVLSGLHGEYDDVDPVVKYWDPELCVSESARNVLTKHLQKPSRALVAYLLTGELDEFIPVVAGSSPEELGVRAFERVAHCNLDF